MIWMQTKATIRSNGDKRLLILGGNYFDVHIGAEFGLFKKSFLRRKHAFGAEICEPALMTSSAVVTGSGFGTT
jgi:hypothetical protein